MVQYYEFDIPAKPNDHLPADFSVEDLENFEQLVQVGNCANFFIKSTLNLI